MPLNKNNKRKISTILVLFFALVMTLIAGFVMIRFGNRSEEASIADEDSRLLFVIRGEASTRGNILKVEPESLEWFTSRPKHLAGSMSAEAFVDFWDTEFRTSKPNAAVNCHGTNAILILESASLVDGVIHFKYDLISGELREDLGVVSLFIDSGGNTAVINDN